MLATLTCTCIFVETFHHAQNYLQIKSRKFSSRRFAYVAGTSQIAKGLSECQINEMRIVFGEMLFVNSVRYSTVRSGIKMLKL